MKISKLDVSILALVLILAAFLRFYKLSEIPPALNWDEVAASYNGWAIANFGKDEWGKTYPLVFTSFRDDKHPIHIYAAAASIKMFGFSDFSARAPGALFGVLNVLLLYLLCRVLFKSSIVAFASSFSLAVSPFNLQFSRTLWEVNFLLFFFLLGLLLFYISLEKKKWLLPFSFISFGFSLLSYHSSKVVVPPILFLLLILYAKKLLKMKWAFYISVLILVGIVGVFVFNPGLTGRARIKQTQFSPELIHKTEVYKKTGNELLASGELVFKQYLTHFSPQFLFIKGDANPRNSSKFIGEFYWVELILFLLGVFYLVKVRTKVSVIFLMWLVLAPFPSALVAGAPNAARAFLMMGILNILTGLGLFSLLKLIKFEWVKGVGIVVFLTLILIQFVPYIKHYYAIYPKNDAIEWQYGMKQIVEFVAQHPEFNKVYMTDVRSQPYIFFLNYLKVPPDEFLSTVKYNEEPSKTYNTVRSFGRYQFGGWDEIDSRPEDGVLYILEDSKCGGLRYQPQFEYTKWIRFPSKNKAFCLMSKNQPN